VSAILDQLGLDQTFFTLFLLVAVLYVVLSRLYFRPFLKLFEARHKRTVEDREAAQSLLDQAQKKLEEYKRLIAAERASARTEYERALSDAKKQESEVMAQAREQAKKLNQQAQEAVEKNRQQLRRELEADVDALATTISNRLMPGKAGE
jgi:F-type H+-transporting ATPase subunit b